MKSFAIVLIALASFSTEANSLRDFATQVVRNEISSQTQQLVHDDATAYSIGGGKKMTRLEHMQRKRVHQEQWKPAPGQKVIVIGSGKSRK